MKERVIRIHFLPCSGTLFCMSRVNSAKLSNTSLEVCVSILSFVFLKLIAKYRFPFRKVQISGQILIFQNIDFAEVKISNRCAYDFQCFSIHIVRYRGKYTSCFTWKLDCLLENLILGLTLVFFDGGLCKREMMHAGNSWQARDFRAILTQCAGLSPNNGLCTYSGELFSFWGIFSAFSSSDIYLNSFWYVKYIGMGKVANSYRDVTAIETRWRQWRSRILTSQAACHSKLDLL